MSERRQRIIGGLAYVFVGVLMSAIIYWHSEKLNAPAWAAYAASLAFLFGGLTVVASESGLTRTHTWLLVAAIASLLTPGAWVAFGPGSRACSMSLAFIGTPASDWLCRGVFGFGSLVVVALLVWLVQRALRGKNAG